MAMNVKCTNCGADAAGKFCASCGAPLQGAACGRCRAPLTPGARFCHRCGTPAGASAVGSFAGSSAGPSAGSSASSSAGSSAGPSAVPSAVSAGVSAALPWAVAGIALLALLAMVAGQRFGRAPEAGGTLTSPMGAPIPDGGMTRAPDISSLTPAERAERLYDRVMGAAERGRVDTVRFFMPMALQAYAAIGDLNTDQRYDLGRLGEVAGDATIAGAQADTILRANPQHLLGLVLASRAARLRGDESASLRYLQRLASANSAERARQLPEYLLHQNDIDIALAELRQRKTR